MDQAWGYVTTVLDGDTFDFDVDSVSGDNQFEYKDIERVRVRGVDAPELGRRGSRTATARLRALVGGQRIGIRIHARDTYGRLIADLVDA